MEATDARVTAQLQEAGFEVRSYSGLLLREPSEVKLEMGSGRWVGHFGTLSPFLRCGCCSVPPSHPEAWLFTPDSSICADTLKAF